MTDAGYTAIKVVIDRSGSMEYIRTDAQGALAAFVEEQAKVPGRATISLSQFDTLYEDVYSSVDVKDAPSFVLSPRGGTALNDAIGRSVQQFGAELAVLPEDERPGNVIFVIITDGEENSSREYSVKSVKALIERQQNEYNWTFIFLAANQDAVLTGGTYGFNANSSITFSTTSSGLLGTANVLNAYTTTTRSGLVYQVTDDDRAETTQV